MARWWQIIPVLIFFSVLGQAHARQLNCHEIQGWITLEPDPSCGILEHRATVSEFPDVMFLAQLGIPETCFQGTIQGTLGHRTVSGKIHAGTTLNSFPPSGDITQQAFTSANVVTLEDSNSKALGELILRAQGIVNPFDLSVTEELVVINGSKLFSKAKGTVSISGNEFTAAAVSGTLCTRSNRFARER